MKHSLKKKSELSQDKWGRKKKKGGKKERKKRGKIGKYATKEMYLFAVWPFHWFQLDLAQVP